MKPLSVGGIHIEVLSKFQALEDFGITYNGDKENPNIYHSALWNGMIAPFTKLFIKGFLWYCQVQLYFPCNDKYLETAIILEIYQTLPNI